MDIKVKETQQWLNSTYPGVISVAEDGITGWGTVRGLIKALQIELNVAADGILGDATLSAFSPLSPSSDSDVPTINRQIHILQGALYCKGQGLDPVYFNGVYTTSTLNAVKKLQMYAGLSAAEQTGVADAEVMEALLNMDAYTLLQNGDSNIRTIQQSLNNKYHTTIGLIPCDGIFTKRTQRALISGLQIEEKKEYPNTVVDGIWGPTTMNRCPTLQQYGTVTNKQYVYLLQYALYANGFDPNGFDGIFGGGAKSAVTDFQEFVGLTADGIAGRQTWASLMVSYGDQSRVGTACDFMRPLNAAQAQVLVNNGREIVGRYITGGINKKLTLSEMQILFNAGLRVFPIYQTSNNYKEYFTTARGYRDATYAFNALRELKFPNRTIVYFAVDFDATVDDVNNYVLPYFQAIKQKFNEIGANKYRIGIYGPRYVCTLIQRAGISESSFVCDMSSGFSCNIGYPLPNNWAFDQISTLTIGNGNASIEIDNNIASGRDTGALIDPSTASSPGDDSEAEIQNKYLETVSRILDSQKLPADIFAVNFLFNGNEITLIQAPGITVSISAKINAIVGEGDLSITSTVKDGQIVSSSLSAVLYSITSASISGFDQYGPDFNSFALAINDGGISYSVSFDVVNKKLSISITALLFDVDDSTTEIPTTAKLSVTLKYTFDTDMENPPPNYATVNNWIAENKEALAMAMIGVVVVGAILLGGYAIGSAAAAFILDVATKLSFA